MIYNHIKKGAEFDLLSFASSVRLSDKERWEVNSLLSYLDNKGVEYLLDNGTLIIPPSQYSLALYAIVYTLKRNLGERILLFRIRSITQ
jgi:hypothetical protein